MKNLLIAFGVLVFFISLYILSSKYFSFLKVGNQQASAQTLNTDWPQLQHDAQHSGYIPDTYGPPYKLLWRKDGQSIPPAPPVSTRVQPVIAYNLVYIPSNDKKLYAFKAQDGSEAWKVATDGPLVNSAAVDTTNNIVFVGSTDGKLYAYNAQTGAFKWSYQTSGKIRVAPVIANNTVYIAATDGVIYALDVFYGNLKWSKSVEYAVLETPAFYDGNLYVGTIASKAFALNGDTGSIIWSKQLKGQGMRDRWITAGNGKVFFNVVPYEGSSETIGEGTRVIESIYTSSWTIQRQKIIDYLRQNPFYQTIYMLDASSGNEVAVTPILYDGGGSNSEHSQPVILPNGNFNVIYRYTEGLPNLGCGYTCNFWSQYLGEYNPSVNDITKLDSWGSMNPSSMDITKKAPIISDESSALVRSGNILYVDSSRGTYGFDTTTSTIIPFSSYEIATGAIFFDPPIKLYDPNTSWIPPYPGAETDSDGNNFKRPTPIANGVFYILHNSILIAVQGTKK